MKKVLLSKNKIEGLRRELKRLRDDVQSHHDKEHDNILTSAKEAAIADVAVKTRERRIKDIENIIKMTGVLPDKNESLKAEMGSWVKIENEKGNHIEYRLVHPLEADPTKSLISIESPLGKSLLDSKKGDIVSIGGRRVKILSVN